ncbi:hypothetical protein FGK63_20375 [Ruegeria sediminis]|uniref:Uncharacterized protein n=1 Tax=Ruegeria sediminis TaxID=2583820 RepID=A0ABY2WSZ7_9RHOB|nr:hypothetical protein [Ruegeria sediminis]TMV02586.1 hypothetical protein FGK63_20375 [Ruegeria sediminis]
MTECDEKKWRQLRTEISKLVAPEAAKQVMFDWLDDEIAADTELPEISHMSWGLDGLRIGFNGPEEPIDRLMRRLPYPPK